jgi:putative redox protein
VRNGTPLCFGGFFVDIREGWVMPAGVDQYLTLVRENDRITDVSVLCLPTRSGIQFSSIRSENCPNHGQWRRLSQVIPGQSLAFRAGQNAPILPIYFSTGETVMIEAKRLGEPYFVQLNNGFSLVRSDTKKEGKGGSAGMRPHELLESALAACICMSIDMAAERAGTTLPAVTVRVAIDRQDRETGFDVSPHFATAPSPAQEVLAREAVQTSPVAKTLGKPVAIRPATIVTT